jgi:hypothetical protein
LVVSAIVGPLACKAVCDYSALKKLFTFDLIDDDGGFAATILRLKTTFQAPSSRVSSSLSFLCPYSREELEIRANARFRSMLFNDTWTILKS